MTIATIMTYRNKAAELRKTALATVDSGMKRALLELAQDYERLAASSEAASLIGPNSRTERAPR